MENPKLRPGIEVFPAEVSGQKVLCMRDTFNYTDKVVFMPMETLYIIRLFDGQHSLRDIQAEFMRQVGQLIHSENIEELIKQLDDNLFLEGGLFEARKEELLNEFRASTVREAALAGKSYPAEPEQLEKVLAGYFNHQEGPGDAATSIPGETIKGAVVPHIDYPRGGHTYAWVYKEIMARSRAEVYVILGTAHVATGGPYVLTAKDFETPLGTLETDKELVQSLSDKCGPGIFDDELTHRGEHSVELQAAFIKFACRDADNVAILPVLCGSFHHYVDEGVAPEQDPTVKQFIDALRDYITGSGKKVCVIASADLSHMGPKFGDQEPVDSSSLSRIANEDTELLQLVEAGDEVGLFRHITRDKDRRRVCGFPSIYTMLKVIEPGRGKLLKYSQWPDEDAMVSFAGMVFS